MAPRHFIPTPTKTLHVRVTDEIISMATAFRGTCMVAIALRAIILGVQSIHITKDYIRFNIGDTRYEWKTPESVTAHIVQHDDWLDGKAERPTAFEFQLDGRRMRSWPVARNPARKGRGPTKKRTFKGHKGTHYRACHRRMHGVTVIERVVYVDRPAPAEAAAV